MFSSGGWLWAVPAKTITYNVPQLCLVADLEHEF